MTFARRVYAIAGSYGIAVLLASGCSDSTESTGKPLPSYDNTVAGTWSVVLADTAGCSGSDPEVRMLTLSLASGGGDSTDTYDIPQASTWTDGSRTGQLRGTGNVFFGGIAAILSIGEPWTTVPRDTSYSAWLTGETDFDGHLTGTLESPAPAQVNIVGDVREPLFGSVSCVYRVRGTRQQAFGSKPQAPSLTPSFALALSPPLPHP
jgi:hypothetical protein